MTTTVSLGELMEFPADYVFHVIAVSAVGVEDQCLRIVADTLQRPVLGVDERVSRHGRWKSLRITARVESSDEVYAVYRAFEGADFVRTVL